MLATRYRLCGKAKSVLGHFGFLSILLDNISISKVLHCGWNRSKLVQREKVWSLLTRKREREKEKKSVQDHVKSEYQQGCRHAGSSERVRRVRTHQLR